MHRTSLPFLALVVGIALAVFPRAASPADKPPAEPTTIEFWHGMGSAQGRCVNEITELYNKSQTRFRVRSIYQGSYNSLSQKLIASCYARRTPALAQMYPGWAKRFYRYGYLTTITQLMESDPEFREKALPDYFPRMIAENTMTHPTTGVTELISLPFNKSVYVLYINQTKMEALGWQEPPKTWEDFLRLAHEITESTNGSMLGFAARPYIEDLTVQAFSAGTQLVYEDGGRVNVDSPEVIESLKFLQKLVSGRGQDKVGYVESGYLNSAFGSEKIGMYIASTASFSYNDSAVGNRFIWRAYRVPVRDEKAGGQTLTQGTNVGIFKNLTDEERAGAWEFLKFLTSPAMTAKWALDTGYMPVRHSAVEQPAFAERLSKDISYANSVALLDDALYEPREPYWESVRNVINREVDAVLLGRKEAEKAMADAKRLLEDAIGRVE